MSGSEVVKYCKSTDKKFFNLTSSVYEKAGKDFKREEEIYGDVDLINKVNRKKVRSYKNVQPYVNKKGKLSFVAFIDGIPSDGEGYLLYDGSTKKYSVE